MRRCLTIVLAAGLTAPLWTQEKKNARPAASFPVVLTSGQPGSKLAPKNSPFGRELKLVAKEQKDLPGFDHLEARVKLGPNARTDAGHRLVLARSDRGEPYDRLFVDADGTGRLAAQPVTTTQTASRNLFWSSFQTTLRVNHARPGADPAYEEFPVALWATVEKRIEAPTALRISRRGFLTGEVRLGDTPFDVVLSDGGTDGVLGPGDWWELRAKGAAGGQHRDVGDFVWAGGKAWKLELEGTAGRKGRVVAFAPGLTEAEDLPKRDRKREDRQAPRAAWPVAFRKDVAAALEAAAKNKSAYFLKFETAWVIDCRDMNDLVFGAKDVATATAGIACVVIDGDERDELVKKYGVKGYPAGILFNAAGKEVGRYAGYQGVKEMTAFFQKVKK